MLLAGLITKIADDEGRFDVEPYGLLDTIFARHDPVTEEDIVADIALLEADETILVYGQDRKFGFLVSWFRRQNIDSRLRRPSSKPEPPASDLCPVTSGAFIDMLMDDWKAERGVKKAWPVVVCREFCAMPTKERNAVRKRLEKNRKERFSTEVHGKERPDVGRMTLDVGRGKNDNNGNDSAPPAGAADCLDAVASQPEPEAAPELVLVPPVDPQAKKQPAKEAQHEDTPSQAACNACLALYGLTHKDLAEDAPKYYAAMGTLIGQLTGGAEELQAWADMEQRDTGLRKLGHGAKPAAAIPARVRKEVTASTWQDTFAAARDKSKHNGQRFIDHAINGRIYERDWDETARRYVGELIAGGVWDAERGMATDDKRHPSQQQRAGA